MIPDELPVETIEQAEGLIARLTNDERMVVRLSAAGKSYEEIARLSDVTSSSVKSAMYRACKRLGGISPQHIVYLLGVHDARAHAKAFREDEVHVIVTRHGATQRITV